jgi:hypothetical protein
MPEQEQPVDAQETPVTASSSSKTTTTGSGPILAAADPPSEYSTQGITPWLRPKWRRRWTAQESIETVAEDIAQQLRVASEVLLDRLFSYLSKLPEDNDDDTHANSNSSSRRNRSPMGLTLPASAIGWISCQLFPINDEVTDASVLQMEHDLGNLADISMSVSLRDRLSLLRFLLPRATHIRISSDTWPPTPVRGGRVKRSNWTAPTTTTTNASITTAAAQDGTTPQAFLEYFHGLVHRPRIDMRVFSHCQVLLVDQVAPSCIHHLQDVRNTLQVLRVERACIYDLPLLLLVPLVAADTSTATEVAGEDPLLNPNNTANIGYPKLTHVKLAHCGLSEASKLRGERLAQGGRGVAPLARLYHLQALCLAHNALVSERAALAGLLAMPFLTKLDLSHNRIVSLKNAHYRVGNIQTLLLSHNRMRTVKGIDHLIALETLWLDYNEFADIADVSGLARLPELKSLCLNGNPFQVKRPKVYRVGVLDLFREQRLSSLPDRATYRQLQGWLPVLDGKSTTMKELVAMRGRTYAPADGFPSLEPRQAELSVDSTTGSNVQQDDSLPIARLQTYGSPVEGPIPVRRRTKTRQAHLDSPGAELPMHVFVTPDHTSGAIPPVEFSLCDVLRSISPPKAPAEEEVVSVEETREKAAHVDEAGPAFDQAVASMYETTKSLVVAGIADAQTLLEIAAMEIEGDTKVDYVTANNLLPLAIEPEVADEDKGADLELSMEVTVEGAPDSTGDLHHLLLSPIKQVEEGHELKESEATTATATESNLGSYPENDPGTPLRATGRDTHGTTDTAQLDSDQKHEASPSELISTIADNSDGFTTPLPSPVHLSLRVVSFPENVWQDDSSVPSSMGTPHREETGSSNKFQLAEENSTFEGPDTFKALSVQENLELYFRLFVFTHESPDISQSPFSGGIEDYEWQIVLEQYPKIQLWPIDRRQREATISEQEQLAVKLDSREEFRRVWREEVVACGKLALRRLTPSRSARYGFHGELLWTASNTSHLKPDTMCECRNVIMCLSDTSLYIILDHDAVAAKAKDRKRKFPLPMPRDATFGGAKWPHALVRHSFQNLKGISIGFGFQRLTLRFSNAVAPMAEEFAYILLTANKMETVELLKEIQELATEAKETQGLSLTGEESIKIDNDDRHVLDALAVAVAPDVIGVIFHYQILQQRWRHGDRGSIRRVCVVTDTKLYLVDEDYVGDGSESIEASGSRELGEAVYRLVDSADLKQIGEVKAADADPNAITIVIRALSSFQRSHNWRLLCHNRDDAERLVEDVRKAISSAD